MLVLFLALTLLSVIALVMGFILVFSSSGEMRHNSGEEVGAQIMGEQISEDNTSVVQKTFFRGKAVSSGRETSISFREIKEQFSAGHYSEALPVILAVGGFLGLLTFGSLALLVAMENKFVGGMIALLVLFTVL